MHDSSSRFILFSFRVTFCRSRTKRIAVSLSIVVRQGQSTAPKNLTPWYRWAKVFSFLARSAFAKSASRAFSLRSVSTRTSAASLSYDAKASQSAYFSQSSTHGTHTHLGQQSLRLSQRRLDLLHARDSLSVCIPARLLPFVRRPLLVVQLGFRRRRMCLRVSFLCSCWWHYGYLTSSNGSEEATRGRST